ncbi:sensor histidine kinase [Cohnella sp. GCM10020058]|uniref:cache domain-containing sensor histidine kinase n=1 Tax=Cohnella sp. GCM10020058 TaxID=3317330 RepID=UPI003630F516
MNVITKVILLLIAILLPVVGLYAYSYKQSVHVIEEQINTRNEDKLTYFLNQIDSLMDQNMLFAALAAKDPEIRSVAFGELPADGYDRYNTIESIAGKLNLFSLTNQVMNRITIYFPKHDLSLSTQSTDAFDRQAFVQAYSPAWQLSDIDEAGVSMTAFSRFFVYPMLHDPNEIMKSDFIIRVDFPVQNITNLLDGFKQGGESDFLFYRGSDQAVYSSTANKERIGRLLASYSPDPSKSGHSYHDIAKLDGQSYLIYVKTSQKLGWSLIDIEPLDEILKPVVRNRNLFYVIMFLLVLLGLASALLLHYHIRVPIAILIRSAEQIKNKNFAYRIRSVRRNEFQQLFDSFNGMATEIDHLLGRVYAEEIRSREAMMKQLQSQINPHFLYNCLAYIVNMAKMRQHESVIAMAHNLGDYYKYTTRNETLVSTLRSEMELARSYMDIMSSQLDKFVYAIDIPQDMLALPIPRLLIQPIIENAIVHGLEERMADGLIVIAGTADEREYRLVVEDNGSGLSPEALSELRRRIDSDTNDSGHTGLWNVNHRLRYYFGVDAGMRIAHSAMGGLRIELYWHSAERE